MAQAARRSFPLQPLGAGRSPPETRSWDLAHPSSEQRRVGALGRGSQGLQWKPFHFLSHLSLGEAREGLELRTSWPFLFSRLLP